MMIISMLSSAFSFSASMSKILDVSRAGSIIECMDVLVSNTKFQCCYRQPGTKAGFQSLFFVPQAYIHAAETITADTSAKCSSGSIGGGEIPITPRVVVSEWLSTESKHRMTCIPRIVSIVVVTHHEF